jgi:hypothetical protein
MAEDREQKTDDRKQRTEGRRQRTDDRGQMTRLRPKGYAVASRKKKIGKGDLG